MMLRTSAFPEVSRVWVYRLAGIVASYLLLSGAFAAQDPMELRKANPGAYADKGAAIELFSEFVEVAVDPSGAFTMGTRTGDPDNPQDDNKRLLFGHPFPGTGGTTLRVDGSDFTNYANGTLGSVVQPPQTSGGVNTTIWQAGDILFTQRLSLVSGDSGRADTLSMEYTATNNGAVSHQVAIRAFFDTQLGDNDGAPFRVPLIGDVTRETELLGNAVPQSYQSFDDLSNPTVQTQGTLIGGMAVRPDRVVWGNWGHLNDTPFDFTVNPNIINSDSAVALYWNDQPLGPGQSRTVVSYYGLGDIEVVGGDLVVGLVGPGELTIQNGSYNPSPFTVTAFVSNPAPAVKTIHTGVVAELQLPPGLVFAPGETASHPLGELPDGAATQTSWQVLATGNPNGLLGYSVLVTAPGIQPISVPRSILVPPLQETPVALHPGFEQGVPIGDGLVQSSIGIADIDQDGLNEIVVGGADGSLYGYNGDGSPVLEPMGTKGQPLPFGSLFQTLDGAPILSSPTLADVDLDRRVDIFFGTDGGEVFHLEIKLSSDGMKSVDDLISSPHGTAISSSPIPRAAPAPGEEDDVGR
ncbi:MAG: hypothetical protein GHCLOJNM_01940 [bacterium]|nr:hypothetical protein [bacterium]